MLGPELGPPIQGLTFSLSLTLAWFILWTFLPRAPTGSLLFWGSHKGLGERITSITPPPVAWPLSNLLPPLCSCQIYPIKVFDGCPHYHTFSLFLFMMKFNKEQTNRQTKQKPKEENDSHSCCPWYFWLTPRCQSQTATHLGKELPKRKCKGKKDAFMIFFSVTALVP